ncbi:MAG: substrate-binding domain-containing protein [Saprospiraceae bacterium]|nr:substrate-binding domain-containing protein [Saprospiraceae bacterium]
MLRNLFIFSIVSLLWISCAERDKTGKVLDTITTGEITIAVEDGYKPVIASCIDVFDSIYRTAKINPRYVSEGEAVNALIEDSVQVIIIGRQLTGKESEYFQSRGFTPPMTPIAYDALAFILHPENRDTVLTMQQIQDLLSGKASTWKEINPKSALGSILLVFDNVQSGTLRYVRDSVIAGQELTKQATALNSNTDVIDYVSKNKSAIGIIAANWISDTDDGGVQKFMREIRIADIAKETGKEGYGPYQAYLATGDYPYKRTIYIINAQARRNGLGAGFSSYLAKDGQRIMLKDGLLPANAVTRLVKSSH